MLDIGDRVCLVLLLLIPQEKMRLQQELGVVFDCVRGVLVVINGV